MARKTATKKKTRTSQPKAASPAPGKRAAATTASKPKAKGSPAAAPARRKAVAQAPAPEATAGPATGGLRDGIRLGIGGWTFEPWRGVFYPEGLPHARELEYAARHLTSIEVNGTFYRTQTPATFRKWASEVPDGFVFALKGPRYATNRRVLAEAGDSVRRFLDSGVSELGLHLGPLLWQFAPTKKFDAADFGAFLELLPHEQDGLTLRHVVEVRHDSFCTPDFIALLRRFKVPVVYTDHATYPQIADVTGDFVYARLQQGRDDIPTAYPPAALAGWAGRLTRWAEGGEPDDLRRVTTSPAPRRRREVFAYVIHEGKVRAPAAAMALIDRLA